MPLNSGLVSWKGYTYALVLRASARLAPWYNPVNSRRLGANRRILIVDANASAHRDFRAILCPQPRIPPLAPPTDGAPYDNLLQGFELDCVESGHDALEQVGRALASARPYALAFIDTHLAPGWDGLETITRLWKVDPQLQIALCTHAPDLSWEELSERLAFDDQLLILKRPFDTLEVRQMASALTWKWQMAQDAAAKMLSLERTIEERVHELLKVSHLLQFDVLTELPNSTLLGDRLTQSIALSRRHHKQLAVMFIGLDRFKRINNALGHPVGDEMLKHVSRSLAKALRKSDSVFRYGSDEFVLVLADIHHPQQTKSIAEKILVALSKPHNIAGHDLSVTASMGISIYPNDGEEALALIKKAETAMRNVKEYGPNDFSFFIEDMNQRAREHIKQRKRRAGKIGEAQQVEHHAAAHDGDRVDEQHPLDFKKEGLAAHGVEKLRDLVAQHGDCGKQERKPEHAAWPQRGVGGIVPHHEQPEIGGGIVCHADRSKIDQPVDLV